jgi:TolA-binding protein
MKDPPRLVEDNPSALERALLDAGAAYRCSAASRAKTLTGLGIAGTAALSASTVGYAGASWFAKIGWTKMLLGVSAIGAMTAVPLSYQAWQRHKEQPSSASPATHTIASQRAQRAPSPVVNPVIVAPTSEDSEPNSNPNATDNEVSAKSTSAQKTDAKLETPTSSLAEELASLDSARALLARGDSAGALARLDAHSRAYPKGRLQLEAEVLRIDALTKNGQPSLAKKHAETFLRKHPNSVLASRVRMLLGS